MRRRALLATAGSAALLCPFGAARGALGADRLKFDEMYKPGGILGLEMSDKLKSLHGKAVQMVGYMAPPLKADAGFFVLTREPMSLCPFCSSDVDWPSDIVVVYLRDGVRFVQTAHPILVSGMLELGSKLDQRTGFVSQVRLMAADYQVRS